MTRILPLIALLLALGCTGSRAASTDPHPGVAVLEAVGDEIGAHRRASLADDLEALSRAAEAEAAITTEAVPEPPLVTLSRGSVTYYRAVGFGVRLPMASPGPPSPWTLPGSTFGGALLLSAPGVRDALCRWAGAPCPGTTREIAAQHGVSAWSWDCATRRWLNRIDCGDASIRAAFVAAYGRAPTSWIHEDGWAALASCGGVIPGCLGGPGCPGLRPAAPPSPDPCAPPAPVCGLRGCESGESREVCPRDCWQPEDGHCDSPWEPETAFDCRPVEPPAQPPPPLTVAVEPDGPEGWRVALDGETYQVDGPGLLEVALRSTGQSVAVIVPARERCQECPPPPTCPPCSGCPPCGPGEPEPPEPPEEDWTALLSLPAITTSGPPCSEKVSGSCAGTVFATGGTSPRVPAATRVRASWEFTIPADGWSSCLSLQGGALRPAKWCAAGLLTFPARGITGTASYVKISRDRVLLRAGEGRWGDGTKSADEARFSFTPGRYRVIQEAVSRPRSSRVTITRLADGGSVTVESSWTVRGQPSDSFPERFPAGRWEAWAGTYPGRDNSEEGFGAGWGFGPLTVEVAP